jgi:hypothetical protein
MAQNNELSRIIASAAKTVLLPLGCRRQGRSRLWVADQGFWIVVIEFQPSGFAQGSYLNVGAMWLWYLKDHWTFDYGNRVEDFEPFQSAAQFTPLAESLALQAAQEVRALREKFSSLSDVAAQLLARVVAHTDPSQWWPTYHAAVAAGVNGDITTAQQLFHRLENLPAAFDWQTKLQRNSSILAAHLKQPTEFRLAVLALIEQTRGCWGSHRIPAAWTRMWRGGTRLKFLRFLRRLEKRRIVGCNKGGIVVVFD